MNKKLRSRFEKYIKNETEVHYLPIETKNSTIRDKQHFEIHSEFRLYDGANGKYKISNLVFWFKI